MLTRSKDQLRKAAEALKEKIDSKNLGFLTEIEATEGKVGGGSAPASILEGYAVTLRHDEISPQALSRLCEKASFP